MTSDSTNESFWQRTEDWHTAGEPFRIVQHPPAGYLTPGLTVAEQRLSILQQSESRLASVKDHPLDLLRQSLCHEPRGHADMYGCFITTPNDSGAHFGALFWHKDGFSTACGHGTMALGYWAVAHGLVESPGDGTVDVVIDVPSGRVVARAKCEAGRVQHVDFVNVPSYQSGNSFGFGWDEERDGPLMTYNKPLAEKDLNDIPLIFDIAYGGATYFSTDVSQLADFGDVEIKPSNYQLFIDLQRKIKAAVRRRGHLDVDNIYGVCFYEHITESREAITQRNVTVFADGQIDRSPCGSATCARLAVLLAEGKVSNGKKLIHESIVGTMFEAFVDEVVPSPSDFPACIPRVRGQANLVSRSDFLIDPADPVYPGFVLR